MSEIKISDEARECARKENAERIAYESGCNSDECKERGYHIQLLLNQRDAELVALRKDKELLDWGQKNFSRVALGTPQSDGEKWTIFGPADDGSDDVEGNTLREAIRNAMTASQAGVNGGEK